MPNLTKRDLVIRISNETGLIQKQVADVIDLMLDCLVESVGQGRYIEFRNFGAFLVKRHKARVGRNPQRPGRNLHIPARLAVKFKSGKTMKARVMSLVDKLESARSQVVTESSNHH